MITEYGKRIEGDLKQVSESYELKVGDVVEVRGLSFKYHTYDPDYVYNYVKNELEKEGRYKLVWMRMDAQPIFAGTIMTGVEYLIDYQVVVLKASPLMVTAVIWGIAAILMAIGIVIVAATAYYIVTLPPEEREKLLKELKGVVPEVATPVILILILILIIILLLRRK